MIPAAPPGARPGVFAFGGHRLVLRPHQEAAVRAQMAAVVDEVAPGQAHGSLACGADVLWAEVLLEAGAAVHVVLPYDPEAFVAASVRPGGEGWVARHRAVLAAAASTTVAAPGPYRGPVLYRLAADRFLGRARLAAALVSAEVEAEPEVEAELEVEAEVEAVFGVVWEGGSTEGPAGTGADVGRWRSTGGRIAFVEPVRGRRVRGDAEAAVEPRAEVRAVLAVHGGGAEQEAVVGRVERRGQATVAGSWGSPDPVLVGMPSVGEAVLLARLLELAARAEDTHLRAAAHAGAVPWRPGWLLELAASLAESEPSTGTEALGAVTATEAFAALASVAPLLDEPTVARPLAGPGGALGPAGLELDLDPGSRACRYVLDLFEARRER